MIAHITRRARRRFVTAVTAFSAISVLSCAAACDKMPLLAPTGSVINLFPTATNVPLNGEIEIIATVIENGTTATPGTGGTPGTPGPSAGTPVQNGTLISFTSTIGRIEPREARTRNGEVRVRFIVSGVSGTATVRAHSGGASSLPLDVLVGTAAAIRIIVTANPQTLPSSGGNAEIIARVEDAGGSGLAGVPVTFTTTAGALSPTSSNTDQSGLARATLTSTATTATVTARSGAQSGDVIVTTRARIDVGVTALPNPTTAGTPTIFSITVGTGANIQSATIDYGDGRSDPLGPISGTRTAVHAYTSPGTFPVTVTANDASGERSTGSTTVIVGALGVSISAANSTVGIPVTFTANFSGGATTPVSGFVWTFDDGTVTNTTAPQTTRVFTSRGTKTVRVDVLGLNGQIIGTATTQINIS